MTSNARNNRGLSRRGVHGGFVAAAAISPALAQAEDPLQQLIEQNQRGDLGQGFDSASRTIKMPKASLPTLSPANIPTTEAAIARYEQIVAAGGWQQAPPAERLRTGARHPAVTALRQRPTIRGGPD